VKAAGHVVALLLCAHAGWALAQADEHAQAITRATCQSGKQSEAVTSATAILERDPEDLGPRLRLADALVDQGCYEEAVAVLEAGQQAHPHSIELTGKLRDVRSLVTEQTYIESLTQAAEGAKLQRNQLRCTRLADIAACDDALKSKPDDVPLLLAKADALMQANRPADAATAYRRATQLKPTDESVKSKLLAAETLQATLTAQPTPAAAQVTMADTPARSKAPKRTPGKVAVANAAANRDATSGSATSGSAASGAINSSHAPAPLETPPVASVASSTSPTTRVYSNEAPPGQTN